MRFRYRLGDQPWRDAGTRRELELTQLPPGEWTLALQARAGCQVSFSRTSAVSRDTKPPPPSTRHFIWPFLHR